MRVACAVLLANLPTRWWGPFEEEYPLHQFAWVSGIVTLLAGIALGIPGYIGYVTTAAGGVNEGLITAQSDLVFIPGWAVLSLPIFLLTTPAGLTAMYLTASGLVRAAGAFLADDVHGDFLLTWIDSAVRRIVAHEDHVRRSTERERLEGPEVSDRLVTGEYVGRPDCELVLLASRRKTDWEPGSYLLTPEGRAFQLGEPFDFQARAGLRTAYPLKELRTGEAIRHAIPYQLPPLSRKTGDPSPCIQP